MLARSLVLSLHIWLLTLPLVIAAYSSGTTNLIHKSILGECSSGDGPPVCASNGLDFVMFPNECMMKETNSEKYLGATNFKKISVEFCKKKNCDIMCGTVFEPVCSLDPATNTKRTFNNKCEMTKDACLTKIDWKHYENGQCIELEIPETTTLKIISPSVTEKQPDRKKSIPCDQIYNPVCATLAGVKSTFSNECLVNAENVKTGKDWEVFSKGVCAEDYGISSSNNDIKESKVHARSSGHKHYPAPRSNNVDSELDGEVNFIFAPAVFQTQFIDENGATFNANQNYEPVFQNEQNVQNSQKITESRDFQNDRNLQNYLNLKKYQNLLNYPKMTESRDAANAAVVPTSSMNNNKMSSAKPIRFQDDDNIEKVNECKFGSIEICGFLEEDDEKRTFGNICELMLRNIFLNQTWVVLHDGKCNQTDCILNCDKDRHDPICVSKNGINYTMTNDCYVNYNICENKRSAWKIISKGACESTKNLLVQDKYEFSTLGFPYTTSYNEATTMVTTSRPSESTTSTPTPTTTSTRFITLSTSTTKPPITYRTSIPTLSVLSKTTRKPLFKSKISIIKTTTVLPLVSKIAMIPTDALTTTTSSTTTFASATSSPTPTYTSPAEFSAPPNPAGISIYGSQPNSVIMRLVKTKAFSLAKKHKNSAYAHAFSKST